MSVYDRDYMEDTEEAVQAGRLRHKAVFVLLVINVAVWVLWQFARDNRGLGIFMERHFTVSSTGVLADLRLHTLLTSCFSHENLFHILFNMLFFWILGEDVERIYGFRDFCWLYIFAGVLSMFAFVGLEALRGTGIPALGASGAIMGIAVVAAIFDPRKPISIWGVLTVPLAGLVFFYVVLDILGALDQRDMVAHSAHLGGAAAGYVFWKLDLRLFDLPERGTAGLLSRLRRWLRRKPALRIVERIPEELPREAVAHPRRPASADVAAGSVPPPVHVDPTTSQRVDELLAKISREGMNALSDDERAFLKEASRKYGK